MKKLDLFIAILLPILAAAASILFDANLLISNILFLGLPIFHLSARNPSIIKKSLVFSLLMSIPLSLFFDTLAALDKSWVIPNSIFPFRFFGLATVEVYIMSLLWVLLTVLFYEYFLEKTLREKVMERRMKYLCVIAGTLTSISIIAWLLNDIEALTIPYFYFWFSLVLTGILFLFLFYHPKLLRKFFLAGLYFFFVLFLFELVALHNNQWIFTSTHYIGFVEFFGFRFPLEELVFWITFCTPTLLAFYEFFDDDGK